MNIRKAFPSRFIRAGDLNGKSTTLEITEAQTVQMDDGEKLALYFKDSKQGFVLNKINRETIASAYGDETDDWIRKPIILRRDRTHYQGRMVDCIRVTIPEMQQDEPVPF